MKIISPVLLGLSLAVAGSTLTAAQDASTTSPLPKILQFTIEYTKPYKGGAAHDKTESAFIAAEEKAKFPVYYIAMNSQSGKARALFMTRYDSFAEWEKDNKLVDSNPTLGAGLEHAGLADGELLDEVDSVVYTYDEDLSYHPHSDLDKHRVYQIAIFHVRPGKQKEWREVVKMVKDAHEKAGTSAHWGMYEIAFGAPDGTFIALTGDPSMSAIDMGYSEDKKWIAALGGEEGLRKLDEKFGDAVESSHSELFTVNPKQSYVSEDWIKTDPGFWRPKPAAMPAAKPAAMAPKKPTP
ncbi:MAG: hypothetical protein P4K93_02990 [Terracidiphilus sp.]|nr:hypothetical protein [Terracidiphilus sp.]MDR3797090.1 hypothetical protein [Terracidiphilus sp.]